MSAARVAVYGGDDLRTCVTALGFDAACEGAAVALVDLCDPDAIAAVSAQRPDLPRVFVADERHRELIAAIGVDPARVAWSREPAALGPALVAAMPRRRRPPTRTVLVTGVRGGVGRTLLVANVARRLAGRARVCVVDATGSGAAAWWLRAEAVAWSALEGLADELSPDHLAVVGSEPVPGLRVVGGPPAAPSAPLLAATVRAAASLGDVVLVDAPLAFDALTRVARQLADRVVVVAYDDDWCRDAVAALAPATDDWLVVSQSRVGSLGAYATFRTLPRDEPAIASAIGLRGRIGGALGRAYDDLAELLLIDAS